MNNLYKNNLPKNPGQYLWCSSKFKDSKPELITVSKFGGNQSFLVYYKPYLGIVEFRGRTIEAFKDDYFSDIIKFKLVNDRK